MKVPPKRIAVIAMGLVIASVGVLYPIHGSISTLEEEVDRLEQQRVIDEAIPDDVQELHEQVLEMRRQIAWREHNLCPNTPEAQQALERTIMDYVRDSGLSSVRMDAGNEVRTGDFPYRTIDLVVEGDALSLREFLLNLESMPWVTRILRLSVEQGNADRRISLQIAVMLESKS